MFQHGLQEVYPAGNIVPEKPGRLSHGLLHGGICRQMENGLHPVTLKDIFQGILIADVDLVKDCLRDNRGTITPYQVIDREYPVPLAYQVLGDHAADITGTSGDQDVHLTDLVSITKGYGQANDPYQSGFPP